MQSWKLDRRLTLQRATITYDTMNNPVETWSTLATVWASKEEINDTERLQSSEKGSAITVRFQIRYSVRVSDLNAKDRISYGGHTYDIVGVKELGRREGLEISAMTRGDV